MSFHRINAYQPTILVASVGRQSLMAVKTAVSVQPVSTKKSRRSSKILFVFVNRLRRRCGIALAKLLNDSGRALSPPDPQYDETLLIPFDQRPFQRLSNEPADWRNGLASSRLMFIPPACRTKDNATQCSPAIYWFSSTAASPRVIWAT
jgi:hypothetical protein